jgi:hypothetical protein
MHNDKTDFLTECITYFNNKTKTTEFKINNSYGSYILVTVDNYGEVYIYYWDKTDNRTYERLIFERYENCLSHADVNKLFKAMHYRFVFFNYFITNKFNDKYSRRRLLLNRIRSMIQV